MGNTPATEHFTDEKPRVPELSVEDIESSHLEILDQLDTLGLSSSFVMSPKEDSLPSARDRRLSQSNAGDSKYRVDPYIGKLNVSFFMANAKMIKRQKQSLLCQAM